MNGGESHLKNDGHFQDEIQPFVLSDEDEKDHSAKNGLDSDRKVWKAPSTISCCLKSKRTGQSRLPGAC